MLEMRAVTKDFSGVRALSGVNFTLKQGEVHALCGENGAGKSTLMKILSGVYPQGSFGGEILLNGKVQNFKSRTDSQEAGIGIIYQELSLVPELSIAENIFLGREPKTLGVIHSLHEGARSLLQKLRLNVDVNEKVKNLGVGQQQLVEIAKALSCNAKILVLDEPTSALSQAETETLLAIMKELREKSVSMVVITHKLNEVFNIADRITILRDGKTISTGDTSEATESSVIQAMVGREISTMYPTDKHQIGDIVLKATNIELFDPASKNRLLVGKINLEVRAGEILGISGLMGAGRSELLSGLFGAWKGRWNGQVQLGLTDVKSIQDALQGGMNFVTEDRKRLGLILKNSIAENMTLSSLHRFAKAGIINHHQANEEASKLSSELRVKTQSVEFPVGQLSGGNQQKVVIGKCLMTRPRVLLLDEPTRGIDVGAKAEIYALINKLAAEGMAIIMASSELPEILGLSDRILVMNSGKINGEFLRADASAEKILAAAVEAI